jgi:RNA polymerase sigma-70 factor (ECF subfamily)
MDTLDPASPLADPEQATTRVELKHAIERAVDALPEAFREVFMLRAVDGRSVAETAELLGVHEETVKTRHHRARARLKATLGEWVDLEVPEAFPFPATRCDRVVAAVLARLELVERDG